MTISNQLLSGVVTRSVRVLRGRRGRRGPGLAGEIEELRHVRHSGVARSQCGQAPARLNESQISRVIHGCMRDKILFAKWRDHHIWHAAAGECEISRYVVKGSSALVVGEEEHAIAP